MPKSKPDSTIAYRIELQQTERDLLSGYAVAAGTGEVLRGVGAVMKPVLDNLTVIIAALIAAEGLAGLEGLLNANHERAKAGRAQAIAKDYSEYVKSIQKRDPEAEILTIEQYEDQIWSKKTANRRATWWNTNVTIPLTGGIASVGDMLTFWN